MAEGPPAGGFAPLVPELDVEDIDVSLDFWCATLGFRVAYSRPERGFAFLEREGAQVMLCRRNGNWEVGPMDRPFGRGINFQIEVKAAAPILAALSARNCPLFRPTEDSWYRIAGEEVGCREFLVQDPDGYLLRFSESLGRRPAQSAA